MKMKALQKGLQQLSEEVDTGVLSAQLHRLDRGWVAQFDVVAHRLKDEAWQRRNLRAGQHLHRPVAGCGRSSR